MTHPSPPIGLTADGCRRRQDRLRQQLEHSGLEAALICDRRHVRYFTGYWVRGIFAPQLLIPPEGQAVLVTPFPPETETAAEVVVYRANELCTLLDHQDACAMEAIIDRLTGLKRIGCDGPLRPWLLPDVELTDISDDVLILRRRKDKDEIAWLRHVIAATEASYQYAAGALEPGITEVELFAGMQAAATAYAGEMIGEFGNDFQIGSPGGAPRRRAAEVGEVAVLDVTVDLRGYCSDMCRSFVVGGDATDEQHKAHERIMQVHRHVEQTVRPGVTCRALFEQAHEMLDGFEGWSFPHHLGHGIGLCPHETPRLNPHWDDRFQMGDVFTVEPGLYGDNLKAGLRIEENYLITDSGVERLSSFPTDLAP